MIRIIKNLVFITLLSTLGLACGGSEAGKETENKDTSKQEAPETSEPEAKKEEPKVSEADLKNFLFSKENTFGWQTKSDNLGLDFFKDGRLAVQGPEGESTMWEGKWSLAGDQLTMECKDCGSMKAQQTVTVKIDGENLILGDKTYTRYAPK
jgi:hypothetical protein